MPLGFSPSSDRILFGQTEGDGNDSLWSVNIDGSGPQMLVAGTSVGAWLTMPAGAEGASAP
jgi:hypothetical protein